MVNDLDAYLIIQHKRKVFVNKIIKCSTLTIQRMMYS